MRILKDHLPGHPLIQIEGQNRDPGVTVSGVSYFDPAGITASTIGLSADVRASANAISAGSPGPVGEYRAGANDIALALAGFRGAPSGSPSGSASECISVAWSPT